MFHVPNKYRDRITPTLKSNDTIGHNGFFGHLCSQNTSAFKAKISKYFGWGKVRGILYKQEGVYHFIVSENGRYMATKKFIKNMNRKPSFISNIISFPKGVYYSNQGVIDTLKSYDQERLIPDISSFTYIYIRIPEDYTNYRLNILGFCFFVKRSTNKIQNIFIRNTLRCIFPKRWFIVLPNKILILN